MNSIKGMKCPECGHAESFIIESGERGPDSLCTCGNQDGNEDCAYSGTVADFIDAETETPQHTPGPWAIDSELPPNSRTIVARVGGGIPISANHNGAHPEYQDMPNARRIVLAVNCHDDLLASLKVMMALVKIRYLERNTPSDGDSAWANKQLRQSEDMKSAQLIIAKAEGKPAC